MSDWYDPTGSPPAGSDGTSAVMRSEFSLIEAAMAKLPTLTGNGNGLIKVNAGGTALVIARIETFSTSSPSGGNDGDVWWQLES